MAKPKAATNIVDISDTLTVFMIFPFFIADPEDPWMSPVFCPYWTKIRERDHAISGQVELVNKVAQKDIWLRRTCVRRDQA